MGVECGAPASEIRINLIAHDLPGAEEVEVCEGIPFGQSGDTELAFDLYLPPDLQPGERRPAVIFLHGDGAGLGAGQAIDENWKSDGQHILRLMALLGYVGLSFDRRLSGFSEFGPGVEDAERLLSYVDQRADELFADANRICLWSISGGTWLGAWLTLTSEQPAIRCAVMADGPLALPALGEGYSPFAPAAPDELARWDPAQHVRPEAPGLLITRASLDDRQLRESVHAFVEHADEVGMPYELHDYGGGHVSWITAHTEERRAILERMIAFLDEYLAD
jgi:acetyl esterase/lipase